MSDFLAEIHQTLVNDVTLKFNHTLNLDLAIIIIVMLVITIIVIIIIVMNE